MGGERLHRAACVAQQQGTRHTPSRAQSSQQQYKMLQISQSPNSQLRNTFGIKDDWMSDLDRIKPIGRKTRRVYTINQSPGAIVYLGILSRNTTAAAATAYTPAPCNTPAVCLETLALQRCRAGRRQVYRGAQGCMYFVCINA